MLPWGNRRTVCVVPPVGTANERTVVAADGPSVAGARRTLYVVPSGTFTKRTSPELEVVPCAWTLPCAGWLLDPKVSVPTLLEPADVRRTLLPLVGTPTESTTVKSTTAVVG